MSRSIDIDRALYTRCVASVTWRGLRSRPLLHLVVVVASGVAVVSVSGRVTSALPVVVVVAALLVLWSWRRAVRSVRGGLAPGHRVTVGYARSGELCVTDVNGQLWLPRGSVQRVVPAGPLTAVIGHDVVFALPATLLSDDDVAFLEGRGGPGELTEGRPPPLSHRCRVDAEVRADFVATWTRRALRTPDVALFAVLSLVFLAVAVVTFVDGDAVVGVFFVVVGLVVTTGSVPYLRRGQDAVQATYPDGAVLRAGYDAEGLTLAGVHTTSRTPWAVYRGHRLQGQTLRLRRRDTAFGGVQTVPAGLLPPRVLTQVVALLSDRRGAR